MPKAVLLAIFTVAALAKSVLGFLVPNDMTFQGNQAQPSIATAVFTETESLIMGPTPLNLAMSLPGSFNSYRGIRCNLELNLKPNQPAEGRTRRIEVAVSPSDDDNVVITGQTTLNKKDVLGKFQFVCAFYAPNVELKRVKISSSASYDKYSVSQESIGAIHSWTRAFSAFEVTLDDFLRQAMFVFHGADDALGTSFSISNADPTGNYSYPLKFVGMAESYCDAYWDVVSSKHSIVAYIRPDGNSVGFLTDRPVSSASTLKIVCPQIYALSRNPYMPSLLKVEHSSPAKKLVSFADVDSSARLADDADELLYLFVEEVSGPYVEEKRGIR